MNLHIINNTRRIKNFWNCNKNNQYGVFMDYFVTFLAYFVICSVKQCIHVSC